MVKKLGSISVWKNREKYVSEESTKVRVGNCLIKYVSSLSLEIDVPVEQGHGIHVRHLIIKLI